MYRRQRGRAALLDEAMAQIIVDAFCASSSFEVTRRRCALVSLLPVSVWTVPRNDQVSIALASQPVDPRLCLRGRSTR